jgi:putative SOS response-associated peptidase YedK
MCGRFTLKTPERLKFDRLVNTFDLDNIIPRYNIAPSQDVLAVLERDSVREMTSLQWGLIPFWSKEAKGFINARVETIDQKPTFSESFQRRRCLIPADGFYEWERAGQKISQPYYFQMKDEAPFAFAGIWDRWKSDAHTITSCAIITTVANELLATIHHRMPVILRPETYDLWLNESSRSTDLKDLLIPFPASKMTSHAVSRDVNDTKMDGEQLLQPVDPTIGVNLRLF